MSAKQLVALVAAGGAILFGVALVALAARPSVEARVVSSEANSATGVSTVTVRTADGVTGTWQYHVQPPGVGASVGAVRLPNNALVDPGWMGVARDVGGLLVVIGVLIGVYVWWRSSHPNPPDKTLRVPGDIVVMSPMKMPSGGHG